MLTLRRPCRNSKLSSSFATRLAERVEGSPTTCYRNSRTDCTLLPLLCNYASHQIGVFYSHALVCKLFVREGCHENIGSRCHSWVACVDPPSDVGYRMCLLVELCSHSRAIAQSDLECRNWLGGIYLERSSARRSCSGWRWGSCLAGTSR